MTQAIAEYRSHVDALNAEANRHLAEVNRIEQEKRRLSMSTEERIRDIQRQGMSEYEATEDRKSQIAEYQEQARRALANGSFEEARSFAQKSMDLAAQVAASETSEARRAEDARRQAEQGATQIAALEARAREASRNQEYGKSEALMRQADQLRAEISQRTQEADAAIARGKEGVNTAVQKIKSSEEILTQTLDAEANAHRTAAQSAMSARDQIKQSLTETQTQVDQLTAKLAQGLKVTIDADASRFTQALADLDKALAEKKLLVSIQADLQQAEKQLREYEQLLKEGKTLPINADVGKARDALDKLRTYADQNALLELRVTTEKAQASITNVDGMIRALERIQTESRHQVSANVDTVRSQIQSLNGANTSSTHTITVRRVEGNATGGLVGAGAGKCWRTAPSRGWERGLRISAHGGRLGARIRPPRHGTAHLGSRRLCAPKGSRPEVRRWGALAACQWGRALCARRPRRKVLCREESRSRAPLGGSRSGAANASKAKSRSHRSPEAHRTGPPGDGRIHPVARAHL